jgi:hypothetical protein
MSLRRLAAPLPSNGSERSLTFGRRLPFIQEADVSAGVPARRPERT